MMFDFLNRLFGSKFGVAKKTVPLTEEEWQRGLKILLKNAYHLQDILKPTKRSCEPVWCREKFCGWGYVEGREHHFVMSNRVSITEADDDMQFSEYCVLIDMIPALLIEMHVGRGLNMQIIAERQFHEDVFHAGWVKIETLEQIRQLAQPVQTTLEVIFRKLIELDDDIQKNSGIEKLLDLEMSK